LQLPEVFRPSLGDLLPTLPSKPDGGGIFFLRQNSEGLALTPKRIMHDEQAGSNAGDKQFSQITTPQRKAAFRSKAPRTIVSGVTMTRDCFQADQTRRAIAQNSLSKRVKPRARMSTLQRDEC
jgi:hypothetical protein